MFLKIVCTFASQNGTGALVQLVRMPPCHGGGHGFESHTHRKSLTVMWGFFVVQTCCPDPLRLYCYQGKVSGSLSTFDLKFLFNEFIATISSLLKVKFIMSRFSAK